MSIRKLTGAAVSVAALLGVPAAAIPAVGPGYGSPVPALGTPSSKPPLPMYEHGGRRTLAPISVVASTAAHEGAGTDNGTGALTVLIIAAGTLIVGAATGFETGRVATRRRIVRT